MRTLRLLLLLSLPMAATAPARPPFQTAQRIVPVPCPPVPCAPLPVEAPCPGDFPAPVPPPAPSAAEPAGPAEPSTPSVTLRVRAPAVAAPGQELEYRIRAVNVSQAAAHHVTVRNPIPKNAEFVRAVPEAATIKGEIVWRLGTLPPGQARDLTLILRPTGGDVDCCARVAFEHGQCVTTRVARPSLAIRKTAPASAVLYDPVLFRIEVANNGAAPVADVVVTDTLPREMRFEGGTPAPDKRTPLSWNLGTLRPGEQRTIDYRAIALEEGTFSNRAAVVAAGGLRDEAASRVVVGKGTLALALRGPERRYANLPAIYEITVSNNGGAEANNVSIAVPLPASTRFVSASDSGQLGEGEVRWALGSLAAGGKRTLRLQLAAQAAGEVVVKASAKADRDLSATAEFKTMFQGVAALSASLTDTDPLEVGQEAAYLLVIRNTGSDRANDVKVTATVPPQMQATDAQGPSKSTLLAGKVTFEAATLEAGKELTYKIYVKALKPGDVRFRVEIEAKELTSGPLREEESTTIFEEPPGQN